MYCIVTFRDKPGNRRSFFPNRRLFTRKRLQRARKVLLHEVPRSCETFDGLIRLGRKGMHFYELLNDVVGLEDHFLVGRDCFTLEAMDPTLWDLIVPRIKEALEKAYGFKEVIPLDNTPPS